MNEILIQFKIRLIQLGYTFEEIDEMFKKKKVKLSKEEVSKLARAYQ